MAVSLGVTRSNTVTNEELSDRLEMLEDKLASTKEEVRRDQIETLEDKLASAKEEVERGNEVVCVRVVNTNFCGTSYGEALANCSNRTACPSGSCGSYSYSLRCFTGIACPATAHLSGENSGH